MLNDKLISVEKALLTRNSDSNDGYKHQIIGHTSSDCTPEIPLFRKSGSAGLEPNPTNKPTLANRNKNADLESSSSTTNSAKKHNDTAHSRRVFSTENFPGHPHFFPKLRVVLECGRSCESGLSNENPSCFFAPISQPSNTGLVGENSNVPAPGKSSRNNCKNWRGVAAQKMVSLVRSLDSVSAIIQSPLVAQTNE